MHTNYEQFHKDSTITYIFKSHLKKSILNEVHLNEMHATKSCDNNNKADACLSRWVKETTKIPI